MILALMFAVCVAKLHLVGLLNLVNVTSHRIQSKLFDISHRNHPVNLEW